MGSMRAMMQAMADDTISQLGLRVNDGTDVRTESDASIYVKQ